MLLPDIGAYLAGTTLGLTIGSTGNLFLCPLPETAPVASNCIVEYASREADRAMGASLGAPIGGEFRRFQVTVRNDLDNYETAYNLAEGVHRALDFMANTTLASGTRYLMVESIGGFQYLAEDGNARHRFTENFEVRKERG